MKTHLKLFLAATIVLMFIVLSCDQNPFHPDKKSTPLSNQPPETFLFLFTNQTEDSTGETIDPGIDTTASKQVLHWWGDDSDGEVIGYYIQWDYDPEPVWTNAEYDTFYVPIRTNFDKFTFSVWAVDNDSVMDPTPAIQTFPVFNSTPEIEFKLRSNPSAPPGEPDVTAYTFPTRTFIWDVSDPDGVETVTAIYYAVDDTTEWMSLPGNERSITLTGLSPGEHRFFAKAVDVAGASSSVISFPDPEDEETPNTWIVKPIQGDVLLVNDFAQDQKNYEVQGFYEELLKNIVGENGYSVWEIGTSYANNPQNSLPYATADIKANLNYFKNVIWFAHLGRPNISQAGLSLTQYIANGGNVFITNGNEEIPDTSWTFTDIDSVFRLNPGGRLFSGVNVLASFTGAPEDSLLNMQLGKLIGNRVSALIPGSDAEIVYRMEPDSTAAVAVPYEGSPVVGVRYRVGAGQSIYFSLPFHYCNGFENAQEILEYILNEFE
ncbi:hypothetical protein GF337_10410 [candidate division KSB1 bacterium]|nr:hypothetical protein [candidate division KSB1 bacterium]